MALSKSVIKAQDIVSCDLCESETKLKWKCLDCDLLMCNKCCDKVHPKFKNAKDHTIVDIKQVGLSGTNRNLDFTNIKCKVHTVQSCCIFCSNCDQLACPSCITKGHAGHTFIEIKEAYDMKVEWLQKRNEKIEMDEKKFEDGKKTLNQIRVQENLICQKTIQDIQHQREALKRDVDKYALSLIEEVNQNMKSINVSICGEEKKVNTKRQKVGNNFKMAKEMLTTMDMSFFFENADIIAKALNVDVDDPVNVIHKRVPKFKPGSILQSNIGTLYNDISSSRTVIDMKVIKEFTTRLKYCHCVSACFDGSLWINDGTTKLLYKLKPEGNTLTTVLAINTELEDMAVTHNNDLLITNGSKLVLIDGKTGKVSDSRYSMDLLDITAVYITSEHNVIVGAMSPGDGFPVTGRRVVIVMDEEGNHLTVYEHDKHNQRIFSLPIKITSTRINGNIVVADYLSEDNRGRVLVLGKSGDILNEYTGCQDINTRNEVLKIGDITTTPSDNICVIDFSNNLHILDSSANLIYCYNTQKIGIECPYCLVFTSPTTFYLGCSPPDDNITNANLYEIQCSRF